MSYLLLQFIIQDKNEQPHKKVDRVKSEVPQAQGPLSHGIGVRHPASAWICSLARKLSDPLWLRVFMEVQF